MRFFIIGSNKGLNAEQASRFSTFCKNLGKELAQYPIELILCSPYEDSADKNVFNGLQEAKSVKIGLELHYPNQRETEDKWVKAIQRLRTVRTNHIKHPIESDISEGQKFAWLYSQIQALNNSDVVIVIGGRLEGSASLLLRLAEAQDKDIVPIHSFEGLAQHVYFRNYYKLLDRWGENLSLLEDNGMHTVLVKEILEGTTRISRTRNSDPVFFLSYSRMRPQEADFVEMQLRRRGLTVLRDENDINESVDISNAIQESIHKADVFIALWCKEYACSPWCYDELSTALKKKQQDNYSIWLLRLDETRIVHPEARKLLHFETMTRDEIEGRVSILLEKLIS